MHFIIFALLLVPIFGELKFDKELEVAMTAEQIKNSPYYKDKVMKIPISEEAGVDLLEHWTSQAFSGLISALAKKKLSMVEEYHKDDHEKCASEADDLVKHAKCLVELESDVNNHRWLRRKKLFDKKTRKMLKMTKMNKRKKPRKLKDQGWIGSFKTARVKRSIKVVNRSNYQLKTDSDRTPFGLITKHLMNTVKVLKKKEIVPRWQTTLNRIKGEAERLKKRKKVEDVARKRMRIYAKAAEEKREKDEILSGKRTSKRRMDGDLKMFASMEKYIDDEEVREMFHNKLNNMTDSEKIMMIPVKIIREAAKLGLTLSGMNTTGIEGKNMRLISPKFMSVIPEENDSNQVDWLSPSLFSLHDEGSELEKNVSLKSILDGAMDSQDSQNFIDFLVEATGISEAVEDAEEKMIKTQRMKDDAMGRGPDGQPLYFTKENVTRMYPEEAKKIELFEQLDKTYTIEQLRDMNRTGYTVMSPKQLEMVYGKDSMYRNPELIKRMQNMTRAEINREIHKVIKDISEKKLKFEVRRKDIVLSPLLLSAVINAPQVASQAVILSPVVMVPLIQSPAVFGSVILSPWVFVPVILAPRLLSPVILDPFLFVPIILSPLALVPVVLSPGVFNPIILSPLLMCPFILSPQVMTPIILSPFALTPLVLNPLALSPLVLSPFVLSPQVLSPQYITAIILCPHALSPAVESNGAMVTVFASPGWLSR
ncbi:unnamed protein product [Caenorhabditis bovis]|uniref:Uncharacterized protein n=1 Tax=Caenorhabditis bovis TaxID=2654633 RepID=A0A8S1ESG4_9PELO|nr:unnamed protein product [Caenorhabditis bovis]